MEERMYWVGKKSRKAFIGLYSISIALITLSVLSFIGVISGFLPFLSGVSFYMGVLSASAAVLVIGIIEIKRIMVKYEISNHRVLKETGIINKKTDYIPYHMVEKMTLSKKWYERILKIGTIRVDTGETHFYMHSIDRPNEIEDVIRSAMGNARYRKAEYKNRQSQAGEPDKSGRRKSYGRETRGQNTYNRGNSRRRR